MNITKKAVRAILRKYFPELSKDIKLASVSKEYKKDYDFYVIGNTIHCTYGEMKNISNDIILIGTIFHEVGHIILKHIPSNTKKSSIQESKAQKFAIRKAVEIGNLDIAKYQLVDFENWKDDNFNLEQYVLAYKNNKKWIAKQFIILEKLQRKKDQVQRVGEKLLGVSGVFSE